MQPGDRVTYSHPANPTSQYHQRTGTIIGLVYDGIHVWVRFDGDSVPLCFARFVFE